MRQTETEISQVTSVRDSATRVIVRETWRNVAGAMHREGGPADVERDPVSGSTVKETWCKDGWPHRDDGPAIITWSLKTGKVNYSAWYRNGEQIKAPPRKRHRAGPPRSPHLG